MGEINSNSVESVISNYGDMIYRIAFSITKNKSDADDVFQDVFLKYIKQLNTHGFKNEEHLKRWLIKVCINCSKDVVSSTWSKHVSIDNYDDEGNPLDIPSDSRINESTEVSLDLKNALDSIPAIKEVAQSMGMSSTLVRVYLTRARKLLKDKLGGEYSFEE